MQKRIKRFGSGRSFMRRRNNLNVVYYLCDRIAVLYKGQIVEQGEADAIYHDPRHPYTRMLLSAVPGSESRVDLQNDVQRETEETPPSVLHSPCPYAKRCPHAGTCDPADLHLKDISAYSADGTKHEHLVRCCLSFNGGKSDDTCY